MSSMPQEPTLLPAHSSLFPTSVGPEKLPVGKSGELPELPSLSHCMTLFVLCSPSRLDQCETRKTIFVRTAEPGRFTYTSTRKWRGNASPPWAVLLLAKNSRPHCWAQRETTIGTVCPPLSPRGPSVQSPSPLLSSQAQEASTMSGWWRPTTASLPWCTSRKRERRRASPW